MYTYIYKIKKKKIFFCSSLNHAKIKFDIQRTVHLDIFL